MKTRFVKAAAMALLTASVLTASMASPAKANRLPDCPTGQHLALVLGLGLVCVNN